MKIPGAAIDRNPSQVMCRCTMIPSRQEQYRQGEIVPLCVGNGESESFVPVYTQLGEQKIRQNQEVRNKGQFPEKSRVGVKKRFVRLGEEYIPDASYTEEDYNKFFQQEELYPGTQNDQTSTFQDVLATVKTLNPLLIAGVDLAKGVAITNMQVSSAEAMQKRDIEFKKYMFDASNKIKENQRQLESQGRLDRENSDNLTLVLNSLLTRTQVQTQSLAPQQIQSSSEGFLGKYTGPVVLATALAAAAWIFSTGSVAVSSKRGGQPQI